MILDLDLVQFNFMVLFSLYSVHLKRLESYKVDVDVQKVRIKKV